MKLRVELFVENIEESVKFYRDILEFSASQERQKHYNSVRKGNVILGLGEMGNLPDYHPLKVSDNSQQVGLGVEIVIEVEDVNDVYNNVVEKGYPIQAELTERPWGMVDFRIADPDGYYLRITSNG